MVSLFNKIYKLLNLVDLTQNNTDSSNNKQEKYEEETSSLIRQIFGFGALS